MESIVELLTKASHAYYNEDPIMDDDTFDALVDQLKEKDPKHPFLKTVGAAPVDGVVKLPAVMPSLEKIKPGESTLTRFLKLSRAYVLSEKLDGLSALWCPATKGLFLRGNGILGQTVSHISGSISSLVASSQPWIIRGELVLPKAAAGLGTTPARTVINGLVHKSAPDAKLLSQVNFIAYEVISPVMKRSDQFTWLVANGFMVPWWIRQESPTEEQLKMFFTERRAASAYDTDGIVVGIDAVPIKTVGSTKPPKDCVAFKMPVSDQSAVTTVEEVIWSPSAQGYLIPRIRIKPVVIGGARIEFCTGHNARTIVDKGIGVGAQIVVRRSGDVIPTLDRVLIPAAGALPTTYKWEWVFGASADATHIKLVGESADQQASQLHLFAKTIDIPGLGPANCKALIAAGITGPKLLWSQTADQLSVVLGPKTGTSLYKNLREKLLKVTELTLMVASNKMPRSVGETKLTALFAVEANPDSWMTLTTVPQGWTEDSFQAFQNTFSDYSSWRRTELDFLPYPLTQGSAIKAPERTVCFTGFRDKALEARVVKHFHIVSAVTSKLNVLVIPDGIHESEKVKKAVALGTVEILECSEFTKKYLI
jgi:NAD-dependent DNA ligase